MNSDIVQLGELVGHNLCPLTALIECLTILLELLTITKTVGS